jgi:hypothetical protein
MSKKSIFRIDLGELDPHFERFAAGQGLDVAKALALLLSLFLKGEISVTKPGATGRKLRAIGISSEAERAQANALAAAENLSLGRAIRLLALDQMVAASGGRGGGVQSKEPSAGGYVAVVGSVDNSHVRIELRPTLSELEALTAKAEAGGFRTVQDLFVSVLRAFLTHSPVIDPGTVAALGRSNLSLVRIGTNLNQIARVLNGGGMLSACDLEKFTESMTAIEAHTREIALALSMARGRWSLVTQEQKGVQDGEDNR